MPTSKNPNARDHFVYVFHANAYPFYVGHGHAGRLDDRPKYIDRLVRLHPDRSYYKWTRHGLVIADLWSAGATVYFDQISENQTKAEANAQEFQILKQLLADGFLLSNDAGNPSARPAEEIAKTILANTKAWGDLAKYRVINRYLRSNRSPSAG